MELTYDQKTALVNLSNWINSPNLFYGLFGYAGTGKTTLLKTFVERYFQDKTIHICSPTHKALSILKSKVQLTQVEYSTIHSFLGIRVDSELVDFDLSKIKFTVKARNKFNTTDILIIDECSMINKGLFEYIKTKALDSKCKVLYVGDPFQAPPIYEKQSLTFNLEYKSTLTKIVRQQEDSDIISLSEKIREANKNNINLSQCQTRDLIISSDRDKLIKQFCSEYTPKSKIVSWTNESVNNYNQIVRMMLGFKDYINKGETILMYSNLFENLVNCEEYVVEDCHSTTITDYNPITRKRDLILNVIECWLNNYEKVYIVEQSSLPNYFNVCKEFLRRCSAAKNKSQAFESYNEWKSKYLIKETLVDNPFKVMKDFDYGYAVTIHKSQGSTYENVLVDYNNIRYNKNIEERNKLLYVGVTRASDKVLILSD